MSPAQLVTDNVTGILGGGGSQLESHWGGGPLASRAWPPTLNRDKGFPVLGSVKIDLVIERSIGSESKREDATSGGRRRRSDVNIVNRRRRQDSS